MTAPAPSSSAPAPTTTPKSGGSAVRLLLLIGILAIVTGAWFYDFTVAGPGSEAKYDEIKKMADEKNAMGVKEGGVVMSKDVAGVAGFPPTFVEEGKDYTIEWYCWWGKIPVLSTWKRYITVVYVGEPRRYSAHYKNEAPPQEALPGAVQVEPSTTPDAGGQVVAPPAGGPSGAPAPPLDEPAPAQDATKPAEGDKRADAKPAEEKPAEEKPAEDKPAPADSPTEAKPAESKPNEDKPGE
jgi:hypothetical protein